MPETENRTLLSGREYIGVDKIDAYSKRVAELGGKVVQSKMPVPGWGYLAICVDTEGNTFGLWQDDKSAH